MNRTSFCVFLFLIEAIAIEPANVIKTNEEEMGIPKMKCWFLYFRQSQIISFCCNATSKCICIDVNKIEVISKGENYCVFELVSFSLLFRTPTNNNQFIENDRALINFLMHFLNTEQENDGSIRTIA